MERKVLLCCGAGISSGLIAQKTRKASRKKGMNYTIQAVSQSEVAQYMNSIDILLIGPHYANILPKFEEMAVPYNVPVKLIPSELYGTLDGEGVLALIIDTLEK